ncbi:MAG: tRNA lysidine(34) synthetase TilS [Gemmatimonadales bacterium]
MTRAPLNPAPSLAERLAAHLAETGLLEGPGLALLAVSGGPDSMALLDLLAGMAPSLSLQLLVVHADHGIHQESARIAAQVERIARERYGLETLVRALALGAEAGETRARDARYKFFREAQQQRGARWLLTAHHADDQVETVLLRLLRGSGPTGLAGIPARGPGGLVRPLLPFTRRELQEHVQSLGIELFDDPANIDPRHMRSWVRAELLPMLESRLGAAARESLLAAQQHAAQDAVAWDLVLDALGTLDVRTGESRADIARAALAGYDGVLAARLVRAAARRAGLVVGPAQAARVAGFAAEAASGRRLDLGAGLEAEAAFERLIIRRAAPADAPLALAGEAGRARFGGFAVQWKKEPAPLKVSREGWTTWVSGGELTVRAPARGDRLVPLGGTGHRAVSRLLMEARVGRADRSRHPVVALDDRPLWIPGVCRGDAALPEPGTLAVRLDVEAS